MKIVTTQLTNDACYKVTIENLTEQQYMKLLRFIILDNHIDSPVTSSSPPSPPPAPRMDSRHTPHGFPPPSPLTIVTMESPTAGLPARS